MQQENQTLGILFVFIAAAAFASAGLFTRVVTTDIPTTLFWRSLIGGACVLVIYFFMQQRRTGRVSVGEALRCSPGEWVIGGIAAIGMICFIAAFFHTSIANVVFVYGTMPLITFLLAMWVLKCKANWIAFGACGLCIAGVGIIVGGAGQVGDFLGLALAFGMTFCWAAFTVATKYFPNTDIVKATYLQGFLTAIAVLPLVSFTGTLPADYFWLALFGLTSLVIGFGVYLLGVKRVTATVAALVGMAEIIIAPIAAYLLFAENPGVNTIIGGAVILLATTGYLTVQHIKRKEIPAEQIVGATICQTHPFTATHIENST